MDRLHKSPSIALSSSAPRFWRDPALPFVEVRIAGAGSRNCYALHTHSTFSIGAILGGQSLCRHGATIRTLQTGDVVFFNPEELHACNPLDERNWSYLMMYVAPDWLAALQQESRGETSTRPRLFETPLTHEKNVFAALVRIGALFAGAKEDLLAADLLAKECALVSFFITLSRRFMGERSTTTPAPDRLKRAADFISENCTRPLRLDDICAAAHLSPAHLIRSFRKRYGLTPHAFLIDRRIRHCRERLKEGLSLVDVALEAGFADQAHFQRCFKKHVAATPGQYRSF